MREVEKLAQIENLINEVKASGYGEIIITITDGQITYAKKTEAFKFSSELNLTKNEMYARVGVYKIL